MHDSIQICDQAKLAVGPTTLSCPRTATVEVTPPSNYNPKLPFHITIGRNIEGVSGYPVTVSLDEAACHRLGYELSQAARGQQAVRERDMKMEIKRLQDEVANLNAKLGNGTMP